MRTHGQWRNNMDKKTITSFIIATLALILTLSAGVMLYRSIFMPQVRSDVTTDDMTGQQYVDNGHTEEELRDKGGVSLTSDQAIFDRGLTTKEYPVVREALTEYINSELHGRYQSAAINGNSTNYDNENNTFTFSVRLGDPSSGVYVEMSVARVRYNILSISIFDSNKNRVYYNDTMKINKRL